MALFVLQHLPRKLQLTSVVLLAAAISRRFDAKRLARRTTHGIWNFWSRGDLPAVGLGTLIFGTMDRRRATSAGALGFRHGSGHLKTDTSQGGQLFDVGYEWNMIRSWNLGGHFGCTNAAFVARYVAPIVEGRVNSVPSLHRAATGVRNAVANRE
ncbi:MAG: hypothetical protein RIK87_00475 [Fuerstiella sp.]